MNGKKYTIKTGWMCSTDFNRELGETPGGTSVFSSEEDCEKNRHCIGLQNCCVKKVYILEAHSEVVTERAQS